jgi:hypothetical protein
MPDQDFPAGERRDDRTQEWRSTVSYKCAQEPNDRVEAELDAEFDQLLDQSSLGTPVAQAYQALTPDRVHKRLRRQLQTFADDQDDEDTVGRGAPDTDEVVLDVVRSAAGDELPDIYQDFWAQIDGESCGHGSYTYRARTMVWQPLGHGKTISCSDVATFAQHLRLSAHVPRYRRWAVTLVSEMVLQGVFVDLRPDVARSIVEIGFDRANDDTPVALLLACSLAVSSSGLADEMIASSTSFLVSGSPDLHLTRAACLDAARWWGMTTFQGTLLERLLHVRADTEQKMLERGPLGTPRQALTSGKRLIPEHLLFPADRPAPQRTPRWRPAGGLRRRRRSIRQRRGRRHVPARPPGAPAQFVSCVPDTLVQFRSTWTAGVSLAVSGSMGVLLVGVLMLLGHHLP